MQFAVILMWDGGWDTVLGVAGSRYQAFSPLRPPWDRWIAEPPDPQAHRTNHPD